MTRQRTLIPRGLLLLSSVVLALSLPAPASANADNTQLEAVAQMLTAMKMPALLRYQMAHTPTAAKDRTEVFQHMAAHVSDQEISKALAPAYANYFSTDEALQAATFYRSSSGQKRADALLARNGALGGTVQELYTNKEVAEFKRIDALPGARRMAAEQKQLTEHVSRALGEWSTHYYMAYRSKAMMRIAVIMREAMEKGEAARLPEPLLEPSGIPTLDRLMNIIASTCVQLARTTTDMQKDVEGYDINKAVSPARLTDAKGIAQSREVLGKADQRMERYLSDVMTQLKQYREQVAEFAPDAKSRASLDNEIAPAYTLMVRLAEVQRALFDVFGRTLDFAESRLGRIVTRDGRLVLLDEADRAPLQELTAQTQKVALEAQQLASDGKKMSDNAMSVLTSGK